MPPSVPLPDEVHRLPQLVGHEDAVREVVEAFTSQRMHHAWIFSGAEGIGKATLAAHMALYVLSGGTLDLGKPDPTHRLTKLVETAAHPDMLVVGRSVDDKTGELRRGIVMDDVAKIGEFLRKTAAYGGWRVVLVDDAHTLNRNAQNAILKILEEPPAHTLIIMVTTTTGAFLPTILSRARVVALPPLALDTVMTLLRTHAPGVDETTLSTLAGLSGGSLGLALKILRTEALDLFTKFDAIVRNPAGTEYDQAQKLADSLSRKADVEGYEVLSTLILNHLYNDIRARALTIKADNTGVGLPASLDHRLQVWEKIRATLSMAETSNLDKKLAILSVITQCRAVW